MEITVMVRPWKLPSHTMILALFSGMPFFRYPQRLAILMGGDLAARSEPGEGSTFTLTLHVGPALPRQEAA